MIPSEATWHDLEHSGYIADHEVWRELASVPDVERVLEVGCGTGRVLHSLAPYCKYLTGVDCSSELLSSMRSRTQPGSRVTSVLAEAPSLPDLPKQGLILGPALFLQLLDGSEQRLELLRWVSRTLKPEGCAAFAMAPDLAQVDADLLQQTEAASDRRFVGGSDLRSTVWKMNRVDDVVEIHRARTINGVQASSSIERLTVASVDQITYEASLAGLNTRQMIEVAPSSRHAGVKVLVFDANS